LSSAQARHWVCAGQVRQTRFASPIWRWAGPVVPIGENRSGSASRQAASSRQFVRAVMELLLAVASADDAEGAPRGTTVPQQPGHLMPVDAVGVDLGQRPGDTQSLELRRAPVVHGRFVMADGFLA